MRLLEKKEIKRMKIDQKQNGSDLSNFSANRKLCDIVGQTA